MRYLLVIAFFSCFALHAQRELPKPSKKVKTYLHEAMSVIQQNALYSDSINWIELNARVTALSGGVKEVGDCRSIIDTILARLRSAGDLHSGFLTKDGQKEISQPEKQKKPSGYYLGAGTGYLNVTGILSFSPEQSRAYATKLQQLIRDIDEANEVRSWVIDLRDDTGGDINAMAMGLAPFLGESIVAYAINPRTKTEVAMSTVQGQLAQVQPAIKHSLKNRAPRIAVLIGPHTGSSGEFTAIAFKSVSNTRFFGQPTAGLTTSCSNYWLPNGDLLFIATTYMADRNRRSYLPKLMPDVSVVNQPSGDEDPTLVAAKEWLGNQK